MNLRLESALLAMAVVTFGVLAAANEKAAPPTALQQFAAIKKLAGDWYEVGQNGKATDKLVSSIRVTSAGTAVEETLFPGGDKEMITMYHLDGDDLVLTHYCSLGNQPRMRAARDGETGRIAFKFIGATNLRSADEHHMHQATLFIAGPDRLQAEWVSTKDGSPCHQVTLDLIRKAN